MKNLIKTSETIKLTKKKSNKFQNFYEYFTGPTLIIFTKISITKSILHASFNYSIIGSLIKSSRHNNKTLINTIKSKNVLTDYFLNRRTKFFYKT